MAIFSAFFYAVLNVFGASLIKSKLLGYQLTDITQILKFIFEPGIIVAFCFLGTSMLFAIKALSLANFSWIMPIMTAINFGLTVGVGVLYFEDKINHYGWLGLIFLLIGIILMSVGTIKT